jgi:3D (Asp-Asp-Asp) domain-containing protein
MINGETYIVEDRGVGSGVIDIYFDSHEEALSFGVKYAKVFEVN